MLIQPRNPFNDLFSPETSSSGNINPKLNSSRYHHRNRRTDGTIRRSRNRSLSLLVEKCSSKRLVMGEVRILKRGEDLDIIKKRKKKSKDSFVTAAFVNVKGDKDHDLISAYRLISNVEITSRNCNRVWVSDPYAGAACYPSPPPSSLPFPVGLIKGGSGYTGAMDLRRLLGI